VPTVEPVLTCEKRVAIENPKQKIAEGVKARVLEQVRYSLEDDCASDLARKTSPQGQAFRTSGVDLTFLNVIAPVVIVGHEVDAVDA
jgi:hypothetical protein